MSYSLEKIDIIPTDTHIKEEVYLRGGKLYFNFLKPAFCAYPTTIQYMDNSWGSFTSSVMITHNCVSGYSVIKHGTGMISLPIKE